MNLAHEGERLFGISQQIFLDTGKDLANVGATMGANDHLAFVKATGPWGETLVNNEDNNGLWPENDVCDEECVASRLQVQKMKLELYWQWYHVANITGLLLSQASNKAQIPALLQMPYNPQNEERLLAEMEEFSSGLSQTDYQQFDKTAMFCLHINPVGGITTEEDDTKGWWAPLNQNLVAWRSMGFQKPFSILRSTFGFTSMTVDGSGNLNVVFMGPQLYHIDIDGLDFKNMELHIAPPNAVTHNIPDIRAQAPALPMEPHASIIRAIRMSLPNDYNLPWMSRDKICPNVKTRLDQVKMACQYPFNPALPGCLEAFANFYPCLNLYMRPSKEHNHGMDSLLDFAVVFHAIMDFPTVLMEMVADDTPWDEEFAHAMDNLGLGI